MHSKNDLAGLPLHERDRILESWDEAEAYLLSQPWFQGLETIHYADGFEYVAIFFAKVVVRKEGPIDVWVIVGDLPPLYLDTDGGDIGTPVDALDVYTYLIEDWIEKAENGSVKEAACTIVERHSYREIAPSPDIVDLLRRRILLLREKVIPWMTDERGDSRAAI